MPQILRSDTFGIFDNLQFDRPCKPLRQPLLAPQDIGLRPDPRHEWASRRPCTRATNADASRLSGARRTASAPCLSQARRSKSSWSRSGWSCVVPSGKRATSPGESQKGHNRPLGKRPGRHEHPQAPRSTRDRQTQVWQPRYRDRRVIGGGRPEALRPRLSFGCALMLATVSAALVARYKKTPATTIWPRLRDFVHSNIARCCIRSKVLRIPIRRRRPSYLIHTGLSAPRSIETSRFTVADWPSTYTGCSHHTA